jgi:hypothetical protein
MVDAATIAASFRQGKRVEKQIGAVLMSRSGEWPNLSLTLLLDQTDAACQTGS